MGIHYRNGDTCNVAWRAVMSDTVTIEAKHLQWMPTNFKFTYPESDLDNITFTGYDNGDIHCWHLGEPCEPLYGEEPIQVKAEDYTREARAFIKRVMPESEMVYKTGGKVMSMFRDSGVCWAMPIAVDVAPWLDEYTLGVE